MGWTIGALGFNSQQGMGIFLITTASRMALGAHPASYTMGTRGYFLGLKRSEREAYYSPPFSAEVKE
jgi:hypothetical protein